jgi:hypothetical protein
MSFFIPLPRNSTRVYREFLKALEQEFVLDSPYRQAQANFAAHAWVRYIEASRQHADHADMPKDNDHYRARMRANRRMVSNLASKYITAHRELTAIARRRDAKEPLDSGRALAAAARGGTRGNGVSSTRVNDVYTRMQRDNKAKP